jgi:hypothetical protein
VCRRFKILLILSYSNAFVNSEKDEIVEDKLLRDLTREYCLWMKNILQSDIGKMMLADEVHIRKHSFDNFFSNSEFPFCMA